MLRVQADDSYDLVMKGWECQETDRGVPFYIHKTDGKTDWDHPYYTKVVEELDAYQEVRYAAYRTALKLRHLQKKFGLHLLSLQCLRSVLEDHGFPPGHAGLIDSQCLQLLLLDLFHMPEFRHFDSFRQDVASDLLHNYLLNLFDVARTGVLKVLSVKLTLAALCNDNLSDKYKYFFQEIQCSRAFVSRDQLSTFVSELIQIPDLLRESVAFGKNVSAAVDSCVQVAGTLGDGVPEKGFYQWLMREPQTLIWLPTLHRLIAAEAVKHDCKCSVCKAMPIVGFRYKCLQCFNFNICQECFFHCRVAKNHHLKHPIQEYCFPTSAKDETKAFFKVIRNKVSLKKRGARKTPFLPVDSTPDQGLLEWEMRAAPSPPSPPSAHQEEEGGLARRGEGEEMSNDSGNSSDQGGEGVEHKEEPSSPSRPSMYDNSNSPAKYLEEQGPKNGTKQDRHSLIQLVHRLRRENRLLRQQLRSVSTSQSGGEEDSPQETWRSVATAQVTASLPHQSQAAGTSGVHSLPRLRSANGTSLSQTVSPICDMSTMGGSKGEAYTSDFFNSILAATTNATANTAATFDVTAQGGDLKPSEEEMMVFASTPAIPPTPSLQKSGPRKPPRLTGQGERNTVSLSYIHHPEDSTLEDTETKATTPGLVPPVVHQAQVHHRSLQKQPAGMGVGGSVVRKQPSSMSSSSPMKRDDSSLTADYAGEVVKKSLSAAAGREGDGGVVMMKTPPQTGRKSQVSCDEMWADITPCTIRKKTAKPTRLLDEMDDTVTPTTPNNNNDEKSRRRSTGSLLYTSGSDLSKGRVGVTLPRRALKSYGSLNRLGMRSPGVDRSLFAVSRGDSILKTPERQEIDKMIEWIDSAFPPDLSYSALSLNREDSIGQRHMLKAAESIGQAMADLVQATADQCYM